MPFLQDMTPVEYLGLHVVATRCRQRLNDVVFERHALGLFIPANVTFKIKINKNLIKTLFLRNYLQQCPKSWASDSIHNQKRS